MAIPQEVLDVIRLANEQEKAENDLEAMRNSKAEHVAAIALLNGQITAQVTIVQSARAALKAAAQAL